MEARQQTQDLIQSSMNLIDVYNKAEEEMREGIERKKFEHFGNENFCLKRFNSHAVLDSFRNTEKEISHEVLSVETQRREQVKAYRKKY